MSTYLLYLHFGDRISCVHFFFQLPRDGSVPDRIYKSARFPLKVTESKLPVAVESVATTPELPAGLVVGQYEGAIVPHVTEEN